MIKKIARKMGTQTPPLLFRMLLNLWRPYRGAGIKVTHMSSDYRYAKVILKKKWYNSNYVGTQFGGSIYAMTDPFYMLMLMQNLGTGYYVWDKGATIDFVSPGKTQLHAEFKITEDLLEDIKTQTAGGEKYIFDLPAQVLNTNHQLVAAVTKKIYVKKKPTRK